MGKNLVFYYSWLGNTKVIAEEISKLINADIRRIEEKKERKKGVGFGTAALGAILGLKSRLKPLGFTLDGYSNIFLGVQVWAAHSAPAVNAFIGKSDFTGKRVYIFITKADEKVPQKVIDSISGRIVKRGGTVVDTLSITTRIDRVINNEDVIKQVREWVGKHSL